MARLIRTEKEVEGRFEEVWIVVEEDPLEQWPEGPLDGGRPARAAQGRRTSGCAARRATPPTSSLPGMLQAAVLRSPHAHATRAAASTSRPALALPGVRAAIGPGEAHGLEEEAGFAGARRRSRRGRHVRPGARRGRGDRDRVGGARGRARSGRRRQARALHRRAAHLRARRRREGARAADVVVEGTYRTQTVLHNSMETHQAVCEWQGDMLHVYISTQYIWGVRHVGRRDARAAGGQGARRLRVHGRRLRLEERPGRVHLRRRRAREADGAAGALRPHAARGEHLGRQPQRDRPAAPRRRAQRRDDRRARRRVHELRRLVGLERLDRRADEDALRLRERPHRHATARRSTRRR